MEDCRSGGESVCVSCEHESEIAFHVLGSWQRAFCGRDCEFYGRSSDAKVPVSFGNRRRARVLRAKDNEGLGVLRALEE